jgi:hypothetical protein
MPPADVKVVCSTNGALGALNFYFLQFRLIRCRVALQSPSFLLRELLFFLILRAEKESPLYTAIGYVTLILRVW